MKAMEAVKAAAESSGTPTTHIGRRMGKQDSYYSAVVSRGSVPKADTLAAMLDVCDYDLAAVPRSAGLPDGALVIDPPETNGK